MSICLRRLVLRSFVRFVRSFVRCSSLFVVVRRRPLFVRLDNSTTTNDQRRTTNDQRPTTNDEVDWDGTMVERCCIQIDTLVLPTERHSKRTNGDRTITRHSYGTALNERTTSGRECGRHGDKATQRRNGRIPEWLNNRTTAYRKHEPLWSCYASRESLVLHQGWRATGPCNGAPLRERSVTSLPLTLWATIFSAGDPTCSWDFKKNINFISCTVTISSRMCVCIG